MNHAEVPAVADYMNPGPYFVGPDELLARAEALMREHGIRHLPVVSDDGELLGVISDRDLYLARSMSPDRADSMTISDAMTPDPYMVAPDAPLNHVARVMYERRIGSAVVVDQAAVVGVFTVSDGLLALVEALEGTYTRRKYEGVTTEPPARRHPSDPALALARQRARPR
jgi:acetoin utilization protein AcuB